ncbi:hypothetical protein IGI04_039650 [Brassica rapa subsp. trilocularis]|uniref:Uncharacterized protein n=1 Tax=Brassica rapa subsp. trilocularis TaxID=1813537 RepID=A0ABQ7KKG6_BRACM|nr:hypothetical protein IGI04_039650 [Brassica rapa subsp. trilocularis]
MTCVTIREDEEIGYAFLSISLSLKLSSTKGDSTSPSVTLVGDVSFGVSHRRRLLRWLLSATSFSVVLLEATEFSLGGSLEIESLLVLSLGGSSPPNFLSIEGSKFIEQRFKQFRSSLQNKGNK